MLFQLEVEHMIWEVDDDMDNCVSFEEMKRMFCRRIDDKHNLEPSQLFHVIQFLVYDKDMGFKVSGNE